MRTAHIAPRLVIPAIVLAAAGCSTPAMGAKNAAAPGTKHSATPARRPENPDLWRLVKNDPPAWVPRAWPKSVPAEPPRGKWIVDARDATSYFVPNTSCGGLTPGVWDGEARKGVRLHTEAEELGRNAATVLIRVPAKAVLGTLLWTPVAAAYVAGAAAAGGGGGLSPGSVVPSIGGIGGAGAGCRGSGRH